MARLAVLLSLSLPLLLPVTTGAAQTAGLGTVSFPNSGARRAQPAFLRGVALLHSFVYEEAAESFREAQRLDPDFAMAVWGEALTYDHPLWGSQDSAAARAALARLGETPAQRMARGGTPRERAYLSAVEALYGAGDKSARHRAYESRMRELKETYPDDLDAAALHALALLTIRSHDATDLRTSVRAAAVAEEVLRNNPDHPGAAHYLIHAYDDPVLAPLGLPVARRYARLAPEAVHALHMPSHIFVQLGHWADMVASNEAAWTASKASVRRRGDPDSELDLHAVSWLHYGYLQQGRYDRATALSDSLQALFPAASRARGPRHVQVYLAAVELQDVVETRRWETTPPAVKPERGAPIFQAAVSAVRRGDRETVAAGLARQRQVIDSIGRAGGTVSAGTRSLARILAGFDAKVSGRNEEAVAALTEAATIEEDVPPVGPPVIPPARELLGELLLELGRPDEAVREFDAALLRTPLRSAALLGRARSAARAGDAEGARRHYELLLANWAGADADIPELAEARAFVQRVEAAR